MIMTNDERKLAFRQMTQEEKNELLFEAVTDLQKLAEVHIAVFERLSVKVSEFQNEISEVIMEKLK